MYGRKPAIPLSTELCPAAKTYQTESWMHYLNAHIPIIHGQAIENIKKAQDRQKRYYDKTKNTKYDYKPGDLILRRNMEKGSFPKERWVGPYVIINKNNKEGTSFKIKKQEGNNNFFTTANIKHMRPYNKPPSF
ncbi:hypothetical protein BDC45DRAFT_511796 [Circinella umbellata]|nr:hypothetical protein BDC45DRAFT_511796 [Circinella umbellata]